MRWWYEQNGETKGPVEDEGLRHLVEQGALSADSRVIMEGSSDWSTVSQQASAIGIGPGGESAGTGPSGHPPSYTAGPSAPGQGASVQPPQGGYGQPPPGAYGAQPQGPYGPPAQGAYAGAVSDKEWLTALLLAIFLGALGVDRFYLGYTGLGIAKIAVTIFTCGFGGVIWQIIDIISIATNKMVDAEGRPLRRT